MSLHTLQLREPKKKNPSHFHQRTVRGWTLETARLPNDFHCPRNWFLHCLKRLRWSCSCQPEIRDTSHKEVGGLHKGQQSHVHHVIVPVALFGFWFCSSHWHLQSFDLGQPPGQLLRSSSAGFKVQQSYSNRPAVYFPATARHMHPICHFNSYSHQLDVSGPKHSPDARTL